MSTTLPPVATRLRADAILLLTAAIWGSAFVAQRLAAPYVGPFVFNTARFFLAALVMLVFIRFRLKIERAHWPYLGAASLLLFGASALQQAGLQTTTAGNAGFITSLYVVLVPFILRLAWRQTIARLAWLAAGLATLGAWLLSTNGQALQLAQGDTLELAGAALWALHVIVVGLAVKKMPAQQFSIAQAMGAGLLNLLAGTGLEWKSFSGLPAAALAIAYVAVFSTAIGYTLQAVGQRHAPPTDAALLLSLESVFAALFGWLWLQEALAPLQWLGGGLILAAIVFSQLKR